MQSRDTLSTDIVQSGTIHCTKLSYLKNQVNLHKVLTISNTYYLLTFDVKKYQNKNVRQ